LRSFPLAKAFIVRALVGPTKLFQNHDGKTLAAHDVRRI
jgi:hypothetical protein